MSEAKFLHTMLRVGDLQRIDRFLHQGARHETAAHPASVPSSKYTLAFVGYGDEPGAGLIELTYNWGPESYEIGTAFGHLALGVPDVDAACEELKKAGGKVTREAGPVKGGTTVIAFVEDPDGYKVELVQRS